MITVATKLDVPIKLQFQSAARSSILGLGDIVVPGITYFNASLVGYTLGMLVTLCMLTIFKHGQPALLYLVPGVLGSLWLTGLVRGELKEMWMYTEDGTLDTRDVVVELDGNGNVVKEIKKDGEKDEEEKKKAEEEKALNDKKAADKKEAEKTEYSLVAFSVTAPLRKPKTH
ncbi:signal peptide peptidase [Colletotrichum tofieldiae]|nr:signal peptide peptidase [Colletotrichum tofieldiae]GKT69240.1 signal peptide peptidase [Colletotrichum tofieldiae]GKT96468.1 signal peptide peptidase [Colletotrichum tofieldiae]